MPCALFILNALPSILERLVPPEDLGWRQNNIPISCPQQLRRFGTRFSEFCTELDRVMLLQNPLHFLLWQDTKTTTHFTNVPSATKAQTQLRKDKLYTWVPLHLPQPPLSFPGPSALTNKIILITLGQTSYNLKVWRHYMLVIFNMLIVFYTYYLRAV